jgi:hypothetical protein
MSSTTMSGGRSSDQVGEALRATVGADDVVTSVPEQAGETFAQQDLVLER